MLLVSTAPALPLGFRRFPPAAPRTAAPGELHVRPRDPADEARLDMACLALEKGPDGFVRGKGRVRCILVKIEPTFDELLAALLLERQLAGEQLPGAAPFAHYAHDVRQGVRPESDVPLWHSPDALFLVLRQNAGKDLEDPATARRFEASWRKMAAVLLPALRRGADPCTEDVLAGRSEFRAEELFLRGDEKNYRRDAAAGVRWWLRLPGEPEPVPGLYLHQPRSTVFQFWARNDPQAPGGRGYRFLAVSWGGGQWTFTTDPKDRIPIQALADELQAAEEGHGLAKADDRWYGGERHQFTVVGAPRAGSRLADDEVLQVFRRWAKAEPLADRPPPAPPAPPAEPAPRPRRPALWLSAAALCLLLLALTLAAALFPHRRGNPDPFDRTTFDEISKVAEVRPRGGPIQVPPHPKGNGWRVTFPIQNAARRTRFWLEFPFLKPPPPFQYVTVQFPGQEPIRVDIDPDADDLPRTLPVDAELLPGEAQEVAVWFPNPTDRSLQLDARANFESNTHGAIHLHVQAVGVAQLQMNHSDPNKAPLAAQGQPGPERGPTELPDLHYADQDAKDLTAAFRRQRGPLFDEVDAAEPLVNGSATRTRILTALEGLAERVRNDPAPLKLVVVALSGHGAVVGGRYFIFLPHDYDPANRAATWITWDDLKIQLTDLGCPVLLVLDSCHAGQAAMQVAYAGGKGYVEDREVTRAIKDFSSQNAGIVLLAAARANQNGWESDAYKHGLMTEALLEGMQGKAASDHRSVISLADLTRYVNHWVLDHAQREVGQDQDIVPFHTPGINADLIPIAWCPPRS